MEEDTATLERTDRAVILSICPRLLPGQINDLFHSAAEDQHQGVARADKKPEMESKVR